MKKSYLIVTFLLCCTKFFSQIVLPYGILPNVKDTFIASTDTSRSFSVLGTGQQNFNFASANEVRVDTAVFKANTNLAQFPSSNMTSTVAGGLNLYFNNANSKVTIAGMAVAIQGFEFPFVLNNKLVYLFAPISYGNSSNTSDSSAISIPKSMLPPGIDSLLLSVAKNVIPGASSLQLELDSITIKLVLTSILKADAYGKITTPLESNLDVLRVSSNLKVGFRVLANVSIISPFGKIPFPAFDATSYLTKLLPTTIPTNVMTHFFYANTVNQPIVNATITPTDTTKYATVSYRKKTINGGGSRMLVQSMFDQANIRCVLINDHTIRLISDAYKKGASYQLYDMQGKLIKEDVLPQRELDIDISSWTNQMLILKVTDSNEGNYFTQKIIQTK